MWNRIRALIIKELLAVWRDPKSRFVLIAPPLIQLFVFSYAATFDVVEAPMAVLDHDRGPLAVRLAERFDASSGFSLVRRLDTEAEAREAIETRAAYLVLVIPPDFSRQLGGGSPGVARGGAPVQVIADGRMSNTAQILIGYAARIVEAFARERAEAAGIAQPPAGIVATAWFNPNLVSQWFIVPGLTAVLTLVVTLVVTALSVARERELGTFEQLLVTPLRPGEILVGKTVPGILIGLFQGSLIVIAAVAWFRVPLMGSLALLYSSLAVYLLSVIGYGVMISSLARTQQQAILGAFMFLVPAVILSGFATPIDNMPHWVQALTHLNPIRYFLVIARGVFLKDLPADLVVHQVWPMAVLAIVNLTLAAWLFRRRLY